MATTSETNKNNGNMQHPFTISVIGGGFIGLNLALGLLSRGIPVTVYEQAHELKELGTGIGFPANVKECMEQLDPRIANMLSKISVRKEQSLQWVDASNTKEDLGLRAKDKLFDMKLSINHEHWLCLRSEYLIELVKLLPEGCLKLGKRLDRLDKQDDSEKTVITFTDGSSVVTDAVIGCDGIKSRVRYLLAGDNNPSGVPHYAHESTYRSVIDISKASRILGNYASELTHWIGHSANMITFPVSNNRYVNIAASVRDDGGDWPNYSVQRIPASKTDIIDAFKDFNPMVRRLIEALPDEQNKWGMFDTLDYPLDSYAYGCVALAGDAAHGATPHHGMGAGMGIEDALVLAIVLKKAEEQVLNCTSLATCLSKEAALSSAFKTYDSIRRERSQWFVASSRRQGQLHKWEIPECQSTDDFMRDTTERLVKLYDHDWRSMMKQALEDYEQRMGY